MIIRHNKLALWRRQRLQRVGRVLSRVCMPDSHVRGALDRRLSKYAWYRKALTKLFGQVYLTPVWVVEMATVELSLREHQANCVQIIKDNMMLELRSD